MNCEKCGAELPEGGGACPKCKVTPRRSASVTCGYVSLACLVGIFVVERLNIPDSEFILFGLVFIYFICIFLLIPFAWIVDMIGFIRQRGKNNIWGLNLIYSCMLWVISYAAFNYFDSDGVLFQSPSTRSPVSRVKGDQRSMSIAIETYYLDLNNYPAWSVRQEENAFGGLRDNKGALARIPTFRARNGTALVTLTSPISYLTEFNIDYFSPVKGATFGYWTNGDRNTTATGYIVWSAGPDRVYNLTIDNVAKAYDPRSGKISDMLLNLTYDPSNGARSRGDIYRTKM